MRTILLFISIFITSGSLYAQNDSVYIEIYPNKKNLIVGYENRVKIIAPEKIEQTELSVSATGCKVVKNKRENTYLIRVPKKMLNKEITITVIHKKEKEEKELYKVKLTAIAFDNTVRKVTK
ncbi:MAG: hypothetical protein ACOZCO_12220 [Bacteroidota bacterium]